MLEVCQLSKKYSKGTAVSNLNLKVQQGEVLGLLGPNGAGKTTTLRCITGILQPSAGEVFVNGVNLFKDPVKAKAQLAFVPEVPSLYELLTVEEHLKFIAMCYDTLDVYEKEKDVLLERYNLLPKRNQLVASLSKGMRQKLSIACAFVHRANVFLFDEPLIGLDPLGVYEIKQEIRRAREEGYAVLISTHLLGTAEELCDRVLIMNQGRKLVEGTLTELREEARLEGAGLEEIFLKLTQESKAAHKKVEEEL
jgi:ABC-2 type transport system ATP-binding protein